MKKYLLFIIFFGSIILAPASYSVCENPKYTEYWNDCLQKNDDGQPHIATDYLCISSQSDEAILYNIILDQEFSDVDSEVYEFLTWLEEDKSHFFGVNAKASYFQGVDIIGAKFSRDGEYWTKYNAICDASRENAISLQVLQCLTDDDVETIETPKLTTENAVDYLSDTSCIRLAEKKLGIYEKVGYDILKINKAIIRKDNRKKFMQGQRTRYNNLLESMRINVSYLERIWKKWTSKTKNAY